MIKTKFYEYVGCILKGRLRSAIKLLLILLVLSALESISLGAIVPILSYGIGDFALIDTLKFDFDKIGINQFNDSIRIQIMGASILALFAAKSIYSIFACYEQSKFVYGLKEEVISRLVINYFDFDFDNAGAKNINSKISSVLTEVNNLLSYVVNPLIILTTEVLVLFGIMLLLLFVDPARSVALMVFFLVILATFILFTKQRLDKWGAGRKRLELIRFNKLYDALAGRDELLVNHRAEYIIESFRETSSAVVNVEMKQYFISNVPKTWIEFMGASSLGLSLISIGNTSENIKESLLILALYIIVGIRSVPSINRIMHSSQALRYSYPIVKDIATQLQRERTQYHKSKSYVDTFKTLEFQDVTYAYPFSQSPTIYNSYFKIHYGTCVGLIGESGSGKTTFLKLICGILTPDSGRVFINCVETKLSQPKIRIGYVPQHPYIASATILDNVCFGISPRDIDRIKAINLLRMVGLGEVLDSLSDGVETKIGDGGFTLSGGQLQRIGIARALYDSPSFLILDEFSSALDPESERVIVDIISELKKRTAILIVTHKAESLVPCDKIYRLRNGSIIECAEFN